MTTDKHNTPWTDPERGWLMRRISYYQFDPADGSFPTTNKDALWVIDAASFLGRSPDAVCMKANNLMAKIKNLKWSTTDADTVFLQTWAVLYEAQRVQMVTLFEDRRTRATADRLAA